MTAPAPAASQPPWWTPLRRIWRATADRSERLREARRDRAVAAAIVHLSGPRQLDLSPADIVTVSLVRDARAFIDEFVAHYLALGVKHMVFVDNGSRDGTPERLAAVSQASVWHCPLPFGRFENAMRRHAIDHIARGSWCLNVDADELLDFPGRGTASLGSLTRYCERHGFTAVVGQMLDMFPAAGLAPTTAAGGSGLRQLHDSFELSDIRRRPYFARGNTASTPRIMLHYGGVRARVFGTDGIFLSKHPLFLNDGRIYFRSPHYIAGARVADVSAVLLHYKFAGDFRGLVRTAVAEGNHYRKSAEYRRYDEVIRRTGHLDLASATTRVYRDADELVDLGFLVASPAYRSFIADQGSGPPERARHGLESLQILLRGGRLWVVRLGGPVLARVLWALVGLRLRLGRHVGPHPAPDRPRQVLFVTSTVVAQQYLAAVLDLLAGDARIHAHTVLMRTAKRQPSPPPLPAPEVGLLQALSRPWDLIVFADHNRPQWFHPALPKLSIGHGPYTGKHVGGLVYEYGPAAHRGTSPAYTRMLAASCHEASRIAAVAPRLSPALTVAGSLLADRLLARDRVREQARERLGLRPGGRALVVLSTWGPASLAATIGPGLFERLAAHHGDLSVFLCIHPKAFEQPETAASLRAALAAVQRARHVIHVQIAEPWEDYLAAADLAISDMTSMALYFFLCGRPLAYAPLDLEHLRNDSVIRALYERLPRLASDLGNLEAILRLQPGGLFASPWAETWRQRILDHAGDASMQVRRIIDELLRLQAPSPPDHLTDARTPRRPSSRECSPAAGYP